MKIHNFSQQSEDWFNIRKGKMTASHAQAIGNNGKGLESYIMELMAEYYSISEKDYFSNGDTERGIELEEQARSIYELERDIKVEQVGFIEYNDFAGCSPDGLIGEDGGIEIKSLNDYNHFKLWINGEKEIDTKHLWQIQMNLLITGRKWWDFISYNPNYQKELVVYRILPDKKMQEKILEGIDKGMKKIKEIKELCEE